MLIDLHAYNQRAGAGPRRWVALPFGFVGQNGRNLRVARSNTQLAKFAARYPYQQDNRGTDNDQFYDISSVWHHASLSLPRGE